LFIDAPFGGGGYSNAILSFPNTRVIALDRDINTKIYAENTKNNFKQRFTFHNLKFSELNKVIDKKKNKADCIIFDLGLSSFQISNLKRGFSFNSKAKLDMCMGLNSITALEVVNNLSLKTLSDILRFFGEEKEFSRIAKNIINQRKEKPINTVPDLIKIIKKSKKRDFGKKINISTKSFQAIRIFVNKEISELIYGLTEATKLLKSDGKIIVISFHSIEDKIVKFFFTNFSSNKPQVSRYYPDLANNKKDLFKNYTNRIIRPSDKEVAKNNSSRSAKLRFVERSSYDFVTQKIGK
jgi:S-adenosyl-methyltransferase MraW